MDGEDISNTYFNIVLLYKSLLNYLKTTGAIHNGSCYYCNSEKRIFL